MRAGAQTTGANPPTSPRCRTQTLVTTWLDSPHKPILGKRKRRNPDAQHYRNGLHKARFASSARHVSGNRSPLGCVLAGSGFGTVTRTDPVTRAHAVRYARGNAMAYPASSARRAIQRFESANSVTRCDSLFASPRYRAVTWPSCHLMTLNGCSTFPRTEPMARSATASADPGASKRRLRGGMATIYATPGV